MKQYKEELIAVAKKMRAEVEACKDERIRGPYDLMI